MEEKTDKEAIKKQKLEEVLKELQKTHPECVDLKRYTPYVYDPTERTGMFSFLPSSKEFFAKEAFKRYEVYITNDLYCIMYDSEKDKIVKFDESGTIDESGNNIGPWITGLEYINSIKDKFCLLSYFSKKTNEDETVLLDDKTGEVVSIGKTRDNIDDEFLKSFSYEQYKMYMLSSDKYYIPGQPVFNTPLGYKLINILSAQTRGYFILQEEKTGEFTYMHNGKKSNDTFKNLGSMLNSIGCTEKIINNEYNVWIESKRSEFGCISCIQSSKENTEEKNFYGLVLTYNPVEHFAVVSDKYDHKFIVFEKSVGDTELESESRIEKSAYIKLPAKFKKYKNITLSNVLTVMPELFEEIPTWYFADDARIKKYVRVIIDEIMSKAPQQSSTSDYNEYKVKLNKFKKGFEKIKKMIKDKIEKERKKLAEVISSKKQDKRKKDIIEDIDSTKNIIDEIYDFSDDIVDGGINQ